ncbi:hypothetical protein G9A89_007642 [Geosiphon pyriformis]|nr:hypothetical protein G9A89_007642 [Geosiphon pyriformis]
MLSEENKSKLVSIYVKYSISIAYSISFGDASWAKIVGGSSFPLLFAYNSLANSGFFSEIKSFLSVANKLELCLINIENSFANFAEQIGELAKRLELFMLAVFQSSSECQLLVTPLLQDQIGNIVIRKSLNKITSGKTTMVLDSSASFEVVKLENMLESLSALVLNLSACFNNLVLTGDMNNLAKQEDIIYWHKKMNNLVSIVTKTKLKDKICS